MEWKNFYWVVIVISIIYGVSLLIKIILNKQKFTPEYGKPTDSDYLGTIMGVGTCFYGSFRNDGNSEVKYIFLCLFFLPILPIACRRVTEGNISWKTHSFSTEYTIYGKEKWNLLEIIQIYLNVWVGTYFYITLFCVIMEFPEWIRVTVFAIIVLFVLYLGGVFKKSKDS